MNKIERAKLFAHEAHDSIKQKRKYSGEPYWVHTDAVAEIVASVTDDEDMICAANFHDILEDVLPMNNAYNLESIESQFGPRVAQFVVELTDVFTKENYPNYNRKTRKKLECERIGKVSTYAKTIKLADLINNSTDIVLNDSGFGITFIKEMWQALPFLIDGNKELFAQAEKIALDSARKLNISLDPI